MRGEIGAVILEGEHVEVEWHNYTVEEVGGDRGGGGTVTYVVSFARVMKAVICLVVGCLSVAHSEGRMMEHFTYRHFFSRIAVVQEVRDTLPCRDLCGMHMPAERPLKH